MNTISVALNMNYGERINHDIYAPMLNSFGDRLGVCYAQGFHRGYKNIDVPMEKMCTTKFPIHMERYVLRTLCKIMNMPEYYPHNRQESIFDKWVANKIHSDKSDVFFTKPNMVDTIELLKKHNKKVVVFAANSEPKRQMQKYIEECDSFELSNRGLWADREITELWEHGYKLADKIITLTNVSDKTFCDAMYSPDKLNMIPFTGTYYNVNPIKNFVNRKKAFISTAYHSILKGTHRLLLAWEKAGIENIPLLIVGSIGKDLSEFIDKYGPFKNVYFIGHRNDLEVFYDEYDAVGILMSLSESAGRTTIELMSKGFPMIVSPDATCDTVVDGLNGFIINPEDTDVLANRLCWFAEDWSRTELFRNQVFQSISRRKAADFGIEVAQYLMTLC